MSSLLKRDQEAPYIVGINVVVNESTMRRTYRLLAALVGNLPRSVLLEREWETIRKEFPEAVFFYPVTHLPERAPVYVDLATFEQVAGMTFVEYTQIVNEIMRKRAQFDDKALRLGEY
jgi:hypothetical protein